MVNTNTQLLDDNQLKQNKYSCPNKETNRNGFLNDEFIAISDLENKYTN